MCLHYACCVPQFISYWILFIAISVDLKLTNSFSIDLQTHERKMQSKIAPVYIKRSRKKSTIKPKRDRERHTNTNFQLNFRAQKWPSNAYNIEYGFIELIAKLIEVEVFDIVFKWNWTTCCVCPHVFVFKWNNFIGFWYLYSLIFDQNQMKLTKSTRYWLQKYHEMKKIIYKSHFQCSKTNPQTKCYRIWFGRSEKKWKKVKIKKNLRINSIDLFGSIFEFED